MLLEPSELQTRVGGVVGSSHAGDFILGTVGFATTDIVLSKKATWFTFSSGGLSVFSYTFFCGMDLDLRIPMEHIKAQLRVCSEFCLWACGLGASTGRF